MKNLEDMQFETGYEKYSELIDYVKTLDKIFYIVEPNNRVLTNDSMGEICADMAKVFGCQLYCSKCGPDVQDCNELTMQLEQLSIHDYEIIAILPDTTSLLCHDEKVQFTNEIKNSKVNAGLVAKDICSRTEGSNVAVFREI